jgi:hypothetical protein
MNHPLARRVDLDQLTAAQSRDQGPIGLPAIANQRGDAVRAWIQHWLGAGLEAMEALLAEHTSSGRGQG